MVVTIFAKQHGNFNRTHGCVFLNTCKFKANERCMLDDKQIG